MDFLVVPRARPIAQFYPSAPRLPEPVLPVPVYAAAVSTLSPPARPMPSATLRRPPPRVLIPLIVACALFMENFDSTVIATALPAIARSMNENPLRLSLAITAYLLSLAVFIPLSGWVADRYGARRVFRSAIVVFTIGSVLCGLGNNMFELVAARILQGLGGAMMVPVGRLVLLRSVPKQELVSAISYLTIPALLAPIFAPPVGGLIATYGSWRWIFFINVPIGVAGFWLVSHFIPEIGERERLPLDLRGWGLLGLGLAGLVFGFETLGKGVLPQPLVLGLLGGGVLLLAGYAAYARGRAHPIMDLRLLRIPTFGFTLIGGSVYRAGSGAFTLLMPLMLQIGFGLSPLHSGLLTFTAAGAAMLMKILAKPIVRRFGFRPLLIANSLAGGAFLCACGLPGPTTSHALIVLLLLFGGFVNSLQFTCLNTLVFADVDEARMSQASSFSSTAQQLALSVGVGVAAQLLHLAQRLHGGSALVAADFSWAFVAIGISSAASSLFYLRMPADAGSGVSGHVHGHVSEPMKSLQTVPHK